MKSILIIVPYENVYPPINGGMQRCFHILHQLAKYFDLTIITNQTKQSFMQSVKEYPAMNGVKVYSTKDNVAEKDIFSFLPLRIEQALRYRWHKKKLKGPADGLLLQYYPVLVKLLKKNRYDVIMLENLATINAVSIIREFDKGVKIIYDAHNVDTNLANAAFLKSEMDKAALKGIANTEKNLYRFIDGLLVCSEKDGAEYASMNSNKITTSTIPNGVNINDRFWDEGVKISKPNYILFYGTLASVPNVEGLLWFYQSIWNSVKKQFPGLTLLVLGSGNPPECLAQMVLDSSVVFTGTVEDVNPWYNKAAISVIPLLTGSGTRLKILEAMGLGLPVISTTKGAEGIAYTNGENIIIVDEKIEFANAIINLLNDKEKRLTIKSAARKLVEEKYDWEVIGVKLKDFINNKF